MTKLIFGLCIFIAAAGGCFRGNESDAKSNKDDANTNETLIDEAVVVESDSYGVPDTLNIVYKSDRTIDRISELEQHLTQRIAEKYPGDGNNLYHSFRKLHEKLVENLNQNSQELFDAYSKTYNPRKHKYVFTDSLKKALKPYNDVHLKIVDYEETSQFEPEPFYYFNLFKNSNITDDFKAYLKLEAEHRNTDYDALKLNARLKKYSEEMLAWENFLTQYGDTWLWAEGKKMYNDTALSYLFGEGDEAVFDNADAKFRTEYKRSFENFIAKHPNTISAKVVTTFLEKMQTSESEELWSDMEKITNKSFEREP